jgi:uncharacterized protein (DUF58 family)
MKNRLSLLLVPLALIPGPASGQNARLVTPETAEFGEVREGETVSGVVRFVNQGSAPLQIQRVQASCGCTTTQASSTRIAPGDTARVDYSLRTRGFRGIVRKSITVYFADPKEPSLHVTLSGTVITELEVAPSFIDFQSVPVDPDTTYKKFFRVTNRTGKPVKIASVRASSGLLTVTPATAVVAAGQKAEFRVSLRPERSTIEDADIWIETDLASRPKLDVPVFIQVVKKP